MCVVSVVMEQARNQWPPMNQWPLQQATEMHQIIQKLAEIDKKLGAKDCYTPTKEAFLADLVKRIEALEAQGAK